MSNVTYDSGTFTASDGTDIYYQSWSPQNPKALLVICHGLGEHGGRYGHVTDVVVPEGFAAFALDHRGHGRSGGKRGHIMSFDEYILDLLDFVNLAKAKVTAKKTFMLGHSLGGLIALTYALAYPDTLDGLCISSPALKLAMPVPKIKELLGNKLSDLWPSLALSSGLDANFVSRDPLEVKAYKDDPLVHDRVSTRFFTEFVKQMNKTAASAAGLKVPLLMQAAEEDHLVHPEGSLDFFEEVRMEDQTMHRYENYYHEIFNDLGRERPLEDLRSWLTARLSKV